MKKSFRKFELPAFSTLILFIIFSSCSKEKLDSKKVSTVVQQNIKHYRAPWTMFSATKVIAVSKEYYATTSSLRTTVIPFNTDPSNHQPIVKINYSYCLTMNGTTWGFYGTNNHYYMHNYIYAGSTILFQGDYAWPYGQNFQGVFFVNTNIAWPYTTQNNYVPTQALTVTSLSSSNTINNVWGNAQPSTNLNQTCP